MKRFTDTEKWDDEWFQEMPGKYQRLWMYICDKCDCAGFWRVNLPLAGFQLKDNLSAEEALSFFNSGKERIRNISASKWFIVGFVRFQVTFLRRLDSNGKINRVHAPIYTALEVNGVDPSLYEIQENRGSTEALPSLLTRQEQDKDKKKGVVGGFEKFWAAYPKKRSKGQAEKAWAKIKPDELLQNRILGALEKAKTSADWLKNAGEFVPYPASWLNAKGWEDEILVTVGVKKEKKPNADCTTCGGSGNLPDSEKRCWCWQ